MIDIVVLSTLELTFNLLVSVTNDELIRYFHKLETTKLQFFPVIVTNKITCCRFIESKCSFIYDLSIRIKLFNRDWYDGVYDVITIGRFIKYDIQFHWTRKMISNMIYQNS